MSLSNILTLVANYRENKLTHEVIDIARNIVKGEKPIILSENEAVDIPCILPEKGGPSIQTIRATLAPYKIDAIMTKSRGRRKAVFISDMDSTAISGETLDELARRTGTGDECANITHLAMNGEMDFEESIRARTQLLAGQPESALEDIYNTLILSDDLKQLVHTMNANNAVTALVSGGFTWFTERLAKEVGFQKNYANYLEIKDGKITGKLLGKILGPQEKEEHLVQLCSERHVKMAASMTTGDGANDIPMLKAAGLGISFHAKPRVREVIAQQVNFAGMRAHLFAQGYKASDIITD